MSTRTVQVSRDSFGLERKLQSILHVRGLKKLFPRKSRGDADRASDRLFTSTSSLDPQPGTLYKMARRLECLDTVACLALTSNDALVAAGTNLSWGARGSCRELTRRTIAARVHRTAI